MTTKLAAFAFAWVVSGLGLPGANLVWQQGPGYRFVPLSPAGEGRPGFTLLQPGDTGILFSNRLSDVSVAKNRLYEIGSGVALGDINGDGDLDLLVNSLGGGTRLFLNDGKGHFTEMTDSGLIRRFGATSLA